MVLLDGFRKALLKFYDLTNYEIGPARKHTKGKYSIAGFGFTYPWLTSAIGQGVD